MRASYVIIGIVAAFTASAFGHTIQVCTQCNSDGSTTFYAATYHSSGEAPSPVGGIIVDGNTTSFTGFVTSLPTGVTNCTNLCTPLTINHWQTVTVPGLATGSHTISTTCTSNVECPSPFCSLTNLTTACPFCGDGSCGVGEDACNCSSDCGIGFDGDGLCCAAEGEDSCTSQDCGTAVDCDDADPASGAVCDAEAGLCSSVPTVSEWGLIIMVLLAMTIGTTLYGRRRLVRG